MAKRTHWRAGWVLALTLALTVVSGGLPTAASAAIVQVTPSPLAPGLILLNYVAAPGEANRVDVSESNGIVVFADGGAPVHLFGAPAGCLQRSESEVACALPAANAIGVDLEDGDDVAVVATNLQRFTQGGVLGGPGRDVLIGGQSSDYLDGGPDDDQILGGGGHDALHGRDGDDALEGEGFLMGEAGRDHITAAGPGTFEGGPGADRLDKAVATAENPHPGPATLLGGTGNDTIDASDGFCVVPDANCDPGPIAVRDTVVCGPGRDRARLGRRDIAPTHGSRRHGCERISS